MIENSNFPFKKMTFLSMFLLSLCFWAGDSVAQSEHEKSEMEIPKPIDKPFSENQSDVGDFQTRESIIPAAATSTSTSVPVPKKDAQTSGEGKKPETAPSTLSFNIFLYIVDKFKAD